jgi:hypothetical protein
VSGLQRVRQAPRQSRRRPELRVRIAARASQRAFERLVLPPMTTVWHGGDFRRVVVLVAVAAVGFFAPSLVLARVPQELWFDFVAAALIAGVVLAGSFFAAARRVEVAIGIGVMDAAVVVLIGMLYRGFYNEIPLLFMLIVAALAIVHGLSAALPAAFVGALMLPTVIDPGQSNLTDPINAAIYLVGSAVVPWAAARVAEGRAKALGRQLVETRAARREAVLILARAAEAKDEVTGEHVGRVGDLAARLAAASGSDEAAVEGIRFAAMLHDVGKLHVPDAILLKPGRLTAEEWKVMQQHTTWGPRILGTTAGFELARVIARSHHENWNGSGYPDALRGENIPLEARIVRITDAFDALRSARPYKTAWPVERCLDELLGSAGTAFDPELTPLFILLAERLFAAELGTHSSRANVATLAAFRRVRADV